MRAVLVASMLAVAGCSGNGGATTITGGVAVTSAPTTVSTTVAATESPPTTGLLSTEPPPTGPPTSESPSTESPTTEPSPTTRAPSSAPPATVQPEVPPEVEVRSAEPLTRELADDLYTGRENGTLGSELAQQVLIEELSSFAQPLPGLDGFEQPFDVGFESGTNLLAVVPGTDLADEYVVVGAHYDHLGDDCRFPTADDVICNGAADNAAGVAVAVEAVRALAGTDPRRSLVIALWDAEEDGLLGSRAFVAEPPVPLDRVVAYVNLDLLGVSLLPSLDRHTVVIGAETGGAAFRERVSAAVADTGLTPIDLSVVFGQGRSDHAPFAEAGVPVVFFSDSTNGCYHTVDDEIDRIDIGKLDRQLRAVTETLVALATGELTPDRTATPPLVTFGDAVALHDMVRAGEPDLVLLGASADDAAAYLDVLADIIDPGEAGLDGTDVERLLGGAELIVEALATQACR